MLLREGQGKATTPALEAKKNASRADSAAAFPVIDLFAGPGGLGEGFASAQGDNGKASFKSVISIERDDFSHQTLLLRHFVRHFPDGEAPEDYYDFLASRISLDELFARHPRAYADAKQSALQVTLGPESHSKVKRLISDKLAGTEEWALVGGPPCQAYSLVGRSRCPSSAPMAQI